MLMHNYGGTRYVTFIFLDKFNYYIKNEKQAHVNLEESVVVRDLSLPSHSSRPITVGENCLVGLDSTPEIVALFHSKEVL